MTTTRASAFALIAAIALSLAACTGDDSPSATTGAAALGYVTWEEGDGGVPGLSFGDSVSVAEPAARLVADGGGDVIEDGQVLALDYVMYYGDSDADVQYSTYDAGASDHLLLTDVDVVDALYEAFVGAHVGAHIVFATPDTSADPVDGVFPTLVMALVVSDAIAVLDRAEGEAVAPAAGLPTVTLADDGAPTVDFADATRPDGLVVQPLIAGAGAEVVEGDLVAVHYTGWLWDGDVFDSSWQTGAPVTLTIATGQLIDGWVQGLVGEPVGSQVLLVVPPDLGYGDADQGSIPGGSTLVFVVDILATI